MSAHGEVYINNGEIIIMSKKLLKKLSSIIANPEESSAAAGGEAEQRLNSLLEDHLDIIAGAHDSVHGSNHHSQIN